MDTFYWTAEYVSILCSYVFLMFLWPSVVFGKHLKGKGLLYRFCFCSLAQIIIVYAVCMGAVFFHAFSRYAILFFFYGIFFIMLLYHVGRYCFQVVDDAISRDVDLLHCIRLRFKIWIWESFGRLKLKLSEFLMLGIVVLFGMVYFSYGAFQVHSYGCGDLYTHHAVIYGLMEGRLSSEGILSGPMHCFVYCINMLFHIPVSNILLYLQCIHSAVFLLSVYCLLRELFCWRFTPTLVLALFLIWGVGNTEMIFSMSCLQWTLPMEFGRHIPFLCAWFLIRYLKKHYQGNTFIRRMGAAYISIAAAAALSVFIYVLHSKGLLDWMFGPYFFTSGYMMVLSAFLIPVDAAFSKASGRWGSHILQRVSFLILAGIYGIAVLTGKYHGYLLCEVTRYDAAVMVTDSIIENFPKDSFVIVSPTDEMYPIIADGWHEELLTFIESTENADYTLPQEYIFIYVEKRPLLYAQTHFFEGPSWLGSDRYWERYSAMNPYGVSHGADLVSARLSDDDAKKELPVTDDRWELYTRLENRTVLEAKAYDFCQRFMQSYPYEMNVYYEDENFVCYYLVQNVNSPYKLGME